MDKTKTKNNNYIVCEIEAKNIICVFIFDNSSKLAFQTTQMNNGPTEQYFLCIFLKALFMMI